jgi:hypothetical protein
MWDSLVRGYKLAIGTLAIELVVSLGLLSNTLGIFAILAMPFIGIAWLPASLLILTDLRQDPRPCLPGYLVAAACGLVGIACVGICLKWIVLAAVMK